MKTVLLYRLADILEMELYTKGDTLKGYREVSLNMKDSVINFSTEIKRSKISEESVEVEFLLNDLLSLWILVKKDSAYIAVVDYVSNVIKASFEKSVDTDWTVSTKYPAGFR